MDFHMSFEFGGALAENANQKNVSRQAPADLWFSGRCEDAEEMQDGS
jgi:hypothetical protein